MLLVLPEHVASTAGGGVVPGLLDSVFVLEVDTFSLGFRCPNSGRLLPPCLCTAMGRGGRQAMAPPHSSPSCLSPPHFPYLTPTCSTKMAVCCRSVGFSGP